jgi:hypothetical protein
LLRIFLVLFIISVSIYSAHSPPPPATLSVSPSTVTASISQNFGINVNISSVVDLYGWEFKLSWNTTLLDLVSFVEGSFLKAGGDTFFYQRVNVTTGYIVIGCTLLGLIPGVSGSGTLAKITFYVKNVGECSLDLYDVKLINSFEQTIPNQALDGYGYFTPPHDIAITNVSALPLIVLPGNIVSINVTVQNTGGFNEAFNITTYANTHIIGVKPVSLNKGLSTNVPFTWDTTGFGKGDYTILSSASIVAGEVDTADNNKTADNIVTILYPGHDVAIVSVEPLRTSVGQGYSMNIAVTAKNYGIFGETFDTKTYVDIIAIETQTVNLASGNSAKLTFNWDTSGFAYGNYTISAYAEPVPSETNTTDNYKEDGWVVVTILGDINGDFRVDVKDMVLVIKHYASYPSHPKWNPNADVNCDGRVDIKDLVLVIKHTGEHV